MKHKLDLLAFAAHPDDVEISASGIMLKHVNAGLKTGIIDLTQGELSTRGNLESRSRETAAASKLLQLTARENLMLSDGFFEINQEALIAVIKMIRKYQPDIMLINAENDRHPDHGMAHKLVKRAAFLSGLIKIETEIEGENQKPWRPRNIYAYIQDLFVEPNLIIDVSDYWIQRMEVLDCFSSQFYNPNSKEPQTPISTPEFRMNIEGRSVQLARYINCHHAEGLLYVRPLGVELLSDLT